MKRASVLFIIGSLWACAEGGTLEDAQRGGAAANSPGADADDGAAGAGGSSDDGAAGAGGSSGDGAAGAGGSSGDGAAGAGGSSGDGCPAATKECSSTCVALDKPELGCAAAECSPCEYRNAASVCEAGSCALGACTGSYQDCDDEPANGCESNTQTDTKHCGACDQPCAGNLPCRSGACYDACAGITCNDHGWCAGGVCDCDPGYGGTSCTECVGTWVLTDGACAPANLTIGTAAGEALDGGAEDDQIGGMGGNDAIRGMDGMDLLNGNVGEDTLNGNMGRDEVHGGSDDDVVSGGADDDVVYGDHGDDELHGGEGTDRLIGGDGNDTIYGDGGDDRFFFDGMGNDTIYDTSGYDEARCAPGVTIVGDAPSGADRMLTFSTGGTTRIMSDCIEAIYGCE